MYRILIADDEDYVRELLAKNIRNSSLLVDVVAVARDGREALKLALEEKPDIVVTDIAMPFMSGLELIAEMQKSGIYSKNVVISGYDEFDYARQAISLGVKDYLLKPFLPKELTNVIEKLLAELDSQKALQQNMGYLRQQAKNHVSFAREKALKVLLERKDNEEEGGTWDYEELGLILSGTSYLAGVLRLTGNAWDFGRQEQVEEFLMLIRDNYIPKDIQMYAVSFDGIQLSVIWCGMTETSTQFMGKVLGSLEKIRSSLKKYYQIELSCALGRVYKTKRELEFSYREAMAVWRGLLKIQVPIMLYGEEGEKRDESTTSSQIRDWKNQIRLSVRSGRSEEAGIQLQGLMKCYASLANKKNDYISVSVGELVYAIQNDMENAGYGREMEEPDSTMQDRLHYGSLMDMKEMLEVYIGNCCSIVAKNSEETKASTVVKQIRLLIEQNLKNPELDLEWMAERVHFSSSYVRQIFKQYVGEGFGEYLIRKRMEQAGMLLQKTDFRIQEIAEECGYDNQRYFASSFKKFYGCTPTEFKKAVEDEKTVRR